MPLPDELRAEARALIDAAKQSDDPDAKKAMTVRALELSLRAETIARAFNSAELVARPISE
jgi:hypothetical protein